MRLRPVIKAVGYFLVVLIFCGLALTLLTALRNHEPFYGRNVYGLPLGTYSTAVMSAIGLVNGMVWLFQRFWRRAHRE
jgi:hypothetical protein